MTVNNINIEEIIKSMTVEQKVLLCMGDNMWKTKAFPEFGLESVVMSDGTSGVRFQKGSQDEPKAVFADCLSSSFDNADALNRTYKATAFPSGSSIACAWNTDLVRRIGAALADECKTLGIRLLLGPGLNLRRHPFTGRNFEYYSEDPCLSGEMAAASVRGVQSMGIGSCLKHFACHNSDTHRTRVDVTVDERALRELYLASFERAVEKSGPTCVMSAYNCVNGEECSGNNRLVRDILKKEWHYDGLVITDWGAVKDSVEATRGGIDFQMPWSPVSAKTLIHAVKNGEVDEELLNERVRRVLRFMDFIDKGKNTVPVPEDRNAVLERNHQLAVEAARESMVLLKNDHETLPVTGDKYKKIVIAGQLAVCPSFQGSGCAVVNPWRAEIPLDCLRELLGSECELVYCQGYNADGSISQELLDQAAAAACDASLILIFAGTMLPEESDDYNRKTIRILPGHEALIQRLSGEGRPAAVILSGGDVCDMSWSGEVSALVATWYSGEGMGRALAEILCGRANPSGKLPVSVPAKISDLPSYLNFPGDGFHLNYSESIFVGYRYYDKKEIAPLFPFGFGLSYTEFEYSAMDIKTREDEPAAFDVYVRVKNVGAVAGSEVVQLYVHPNNPAVIRPVRELKGFTKLYLEPGASQYAHFELHFRDFAYYSPDAGRWIADNDTYDIEMGASSRDIRQSQSIRLQNQKAYRPPLRYDCGFPEFFEHEGAREKLFEFLKSRGIADASILNDGTVETLKGTFWSIRSFLDMYCGSITYEDIDALIRSVQE